jgi:hypothetical protein
VTALARQTGGFVQAQQSGGLGGGFGQFLHHGFGGGRDRATQVALPRRADATTAIPVAMAAKVKARCMPAAKGCSISWGRTTGR